MADVADLPKEYGKNLRACWCCSLVKTQDQFSYDGCDNCPFLKMEEDVDNVRECTSPNFNGLAAVVEPTTSWAAKWQHITKKAAGVYALNIQGDMPLAVIDMAEQAGVQPVMRS